jgi:hypothetical protein
MEHITAIQETIDQNRDAIPTEVARQVLASTQKLYDGLDKPKLYCVTLTHVHAVSFVECDDDAAPEAVVKLKDITQTLILESIDEATFRAIPYTCASHLVLMGKIHERWASEKTPKVIATRAHSGTRAQRHARIRFSPHAVALELRSTLGFLFGVSPVAPLLLTAAACALGGAGYYAMQLAEWREMAERPEEGAYTKM